MLQHEMREATSKEARLLAIEAEQSQEICTLRTRLQDLNEKYVISLEEYEEKSDVAQIQGEKIRQLQGEVHRVGEESTTSLQDAQGMTAWLRLKGTLRAIEDRQKAQVFAQWRAVVADRSRL